MTVTIAPFSTEHLEQAAALLAARHRHDRTWAPDFSPEYEDPAATLLILRDLLATEGTSGVVAMSEGRVAAYLLGTLDLGVPTQMFAGFAHPRAVDVPYAGHASNTQEDSSLYPRLYAALAQIWVRNGLIGHTITVPARPDAIEIWGNVGFSRFVVLSVRQTAATVEIAPTCGKEFEFRRATPADEEALNGLVTEVFRSFSDPPIFVPFLPETATERRRFVAERLADPACSFWLAIVRGQPVGIQLFVEPHSAHWHEPKLETPPRTLYLCLASTAPEARSTGVGAALTAHTMAWARAAGYERCTAHVLTASRAAAFWQGLGFRPMTHWLTRTIDERTTWARGWS
jgi:GNAT superfamily N-acetyltransferase